MAVLKGSELMAFKNTAKSGDAVWKAIALATSHKLSINADTKETSTKDNAGDGKWQSSEVGTLNWSVTTENLVSADGSNYNDLFDAMVAREPIDLVFANGTKADSNSDTNDQTVQTDKIYKKGKAIITALEVNAPNGDNATMSATFTGVGGLVSTN